MVRRSDLVRRVREPASAAIAGIVFAVVLVAVIALLRSGAPELGADAAPWTRDPVLRGRVSTALNLIPFAGIAFLWFIAVLRAQVGRTEDRFIGTVFLGSGLVFVAMMFAAAAALKAALVLVDAGVEPSLELRGYAWTLAASLLGLFGTRMAAVFIASVATAGRRAGVLPPWLTFSGYAVAVVLLLAPPLPAGVQYAFPFWVLVLSGYLLTGRHRPAD